MSVVLITGSAGLIGSEAVRFFAQKGLTIVGIDNNLRKEFFGEDACTQWNLSQLQKQVQDYAHFSCDIRNFAPLEKIFTHYGQSISGIIHCAAQPSHDWAADHVHTDFSVNALGTLNLLELARVYCPDATFMFLSTNKVYGDAPNALPLEELSTRWEVLKSHPFYGFGVDEHFSIDQSKHSLFGVSKAAADLLVQEYGRYFGMKTACFRGGCLTGPAHSGTKLHGFLSYLMRCTLNHIPYTVMGYKGKQVRDNIHSYDLVNALWHFYSAPQIARVYNLGGGPQNNCSMLEAIALCEEISGQELTWEYQENNRIGDHIWWISDVRKFKADYPSWDYQYDLKRTLMQMHDVLKEMKASSHEYA